MNRTRGPSTSVTVLGAVAVFSFNGETMLPTVDLSFLSSAIGGVLITTIIFFTFVAFVAMFMTAVAMPEAEDELEA